MHTALLQRCRSACQPLQGPFGCIAFHARITMHMRIRMCVATERHIHAYARAFHCNAMCATHMQCLPCTCAHSCLRTHACAFAVSVDGQPYNKAMRKRTGFVLQDDVLYESLTVKVRVEGRGGCVWGAKERGMRGGVPVVLCRVAGGGMVGWSLQPHPWGPAPREAGPHGWSSRCPPLPEYMAAQCPRVSGQLPRHSDASCRLCALPTAALLAAAQCAVATGTRHSPCLGCCPV